MDDAGLELPVAAGPGDRDSYERAQAPVGSDARHLETLLRLTGSTDPACKASRLIGEFGSFGAVIAGTGRRLRLALPHDSEAVAAIGWFRAAMLDALRPPRGRRLALSDWPALTRYLQARIGFGDAERLHALFLDARNRLLSDEVVAEGGPGAVAVPLRHVLTRALDLGASGLILVHNHPSGDPTPSRADVAATGTAAKVCDALGIELLDHLIVSRGRSTSMRRIGALRA